MFKKVSSLAVGLLVAVMASSVSAAVVTDVVEVDNWFNKYGETRSWTHDINGPDFDPAAMDVSAAELTFDLYDDRGRDGRDRVRICFFRCFSAPGNFETAFIVIEDFDFEDERLFEVDTGLLTQNVGLTGLISLSNTGLLDVSITSLTGDFGLNTSTLKAYTVSVPEPGSLALLGLGLIGLGVARRRT